MFGLAVVAPVIVLVVFAPLTALHGPFAMNTVDRLRGINAEHWFSTGNMGCDIFARVLYDTRISLIVGFTVDLVSNLLRLVIRLYTSTNKLADNILMRVCDDLRVIPNTLLAITIIAMLGTNIKDVTISLIAANIPNMARPACSQALVVKEQTYIGTMRCLDSSRRRILWAHIMPNILSPMVVQMTFVFANTIITGAVPSFLGAGVPTSVSSWDNISKKGKDMVHTA